MRSILSWMQLALALALVWAGACNWSEPAIEARVELAPGAAGTRCVIVLAHAAGVPDAPTNPIQRPAGRDVLEVGVYRGALPASIFLVARGFDDDACTALNEESSPVPATFERGKLPRVTLHLQGASCPSCPTTECSTSACLPDGGCSTPNILTGQRCDGGTCQASGACGATLPASSFPYVPSNFDPDAVADAGIAGPTSLSCDAWFDSTDGGMGWCGGQPAPAVHVVAQPRGPEAVVLAMRGLDLSGSLTLFGSRPVILAVYGDAIVAGTISARSTTGQDAGAGADPAGACSAGAGGPSGNVGSGGGGGGHGQAGGGGGNVTGGSAGGGGGPVNGSASIVPLRGGCSGGAGGRPNDTLATGGGGGRGGGAVQLSASGTLTLSGTVAAGGAGGQGGRVDLTGLAIQGGNGGGGGGSGGAVLLEGQDVRLAPSARLAANGGGGGEGGDGVLATGTNGNPGADAPDTAASGGAGGAGAAPCAGDGGTGGSAGGGAQPGGDVAYAQGGCAGGGGGGGAGRIRVNSGRSCQVDAGMMSPAPTLGGSCP